MRRQFFLIFLMTFLIFYLLLILPVCKKISSEKKIFSVVNAGGHKERVSNQDLVKKISRMAGFIGVDTEVSASSENGASQSLVHVRAVGDYQQLMKLITTLTETSKDIFISSLSLFVVDSQENEAGLRIDATFGLYL